MAVSIYRLSEKALTLSWEASIDVVTNGLVMAADRRIASNPFPGWIENVPAYHTLTVYYDPYFTDIEPAVELLKIAQAAGEENYTGSRRVRVPVNYNGPDLQLAASLLGIEASRLIELHKNTIYSVFMLGFMPGFPYMGELPAELEIPRKAVPAPKVAAGSVAIAGKQTGIYPFDSPGGWYVIGSTNIKLFENGDSFFKPGDEVEFYESTD